MKRDDPSSAAGRTAAAEVPPGARRPLDVPHGPGGDPPSPGPARPAASRHPDGEAAADPVAPPPSGSTGEEDGRSGGGRNGRETRRRRTAHLSLRGLLAWCALIAFVLHTVAVLYTWFAWRAEPGARGWWVVFTDLPVSFLYAHFTHELLLLWSLVLGGIQWALTGAGVAWVVWRFTAVRERRRS